MNDRKATKTATVVDAMLILTRGEEVLLAERRDTGDEGIWTDSARYGC